MLDTCDVELPVVLAFEEAAAVESCSSVELLDFVGFGVTASFEELSLSGLKHTSE